MKKYVFWQQVVKTIRNECTIEANSLAEATDIHNNGGADYEEVHCFDEEIIDEGTTELN